MAVVSSPGVSNFRPQKTHVNQVLSHTHPPHTLNPLSWGRSTSSRQHSYLFPELFTPSSWLITVIIWQAMLFGLRPPSLQAQPARRIWVELGRRKQKVLSAVAGLPGELSLTSSIYHHGDKQVREKQGRTSHHPPCGS